MVLVQCQHCVLILECFPVCFVSFFFFWRHITNSSVVSRFAIPLTLAKTSLKIKERKD